jgi:AraC-like DNA-binding protein
MIARRSEPSGSGVDPTIPGVHAAHLAELVGRWGVSQEQLLGPLGLNMHELADPAARLSIHMLRRLVSRARTLTGEPGLGFHLGLHSRVSAHGYLGIAAMAASTLREALELACRFAPTRSTALALRLEEHDAQASIIVDELCSFGDARDFVILSLLVGLSHIGESLVGARLDGHIDFAFPEPSYVARLAGELGPRLHFDQPVHRIVSAREHLDLPLKLADPDALRLARARCEHELSLLGFRQGVASRVRAILAASDGQLPLLGAIAAELGTSTRTLKRKLAGEGVSYSKLVDDARAARAMVLIRSELTVDEIADRLGYSDAANFTRAFRRWAGKSPRALRSDAKRARRLSK